MRENVVNVLKSILMFFMYLMVMLFFGLVGYVVRHILGLSNMTLPVLFGQVGSLLFTLYLIKKSNSRSLKDIQVTKKNILMVFLTVVAIIGTQVLLLSRVKTDTTSTEMIASFSVVSKVLIAVILAPLTEELFFRKVLSETIKDTKVFLIASSILFGLAHFPSFGDVVSSFYVVGVLSLTGLLLVVCYIKTKSVVFSVIAHSVFNMFTLIVYHYTMG